MSIKPQVGMMVWALAAGAIAMVASPVVARHSWGKYHWERGTDPLVISLVDNTDNNWPSRVFTAHIDWNHSPVINSPLVQSGDNPNCSFVAGQINVCNGGYGNTGWLGIASIMIGSGNHITAGITKFNDTYFAPGSSYNTDFWRQLVTCQEIGHTYGLSHQNENFKTDKTTSCMEYTSWPEGNEHPDAHDYEQLLAIYDHDDTGGGGGGGGRGGGRGGGKGRPLGIGNTLADWGKPVDFLPNGKPFIFEKQVNGHRVVTHVTWVIDATEADHVRHF